ncbi:helix-turn-helix transcriptional regulator [Brevibacillus borstelensis]|uniref:helix-turn-helix transcriptional regulator n=1 Tax=Brevibacillus borstelensis TaxID=45462 RepID=UPI00287F7B3A|nr:helix-turn-helix transcriptional regulator [Brevibacillus borstelensis]WNF07211.1 helix-turn-helix transcriptional regulator [Brevibacillus borstelensis]
MKFTVKQARLLAGLTQKEVSGMLRVHVQTYMKWERNPEEMSISKAKQFSKIVGREFDEIFFDSESNLIRQSTA